MRTKSDFALPGVGIDTKEQYIVVTTVFLEAPSTV